MKKPLQNIIAVAGFDVLSRLFGFAANAYLARILGAAGFGVMSIGFSVLSYVAMISNPGLSILGTRNVAAGEEARGFRPGSVNVLRFFVALACVLLLGAAGFLFTEKLNLSLTVVLFSFSALPMAFSLDWYFQGKENLIASSGSKAITAFVYVVLVLILVRTETDVSFTAVAYLAGNVAAALVLAELFRRQRRPTDRTLNSRSWKDLLLSSLPLGINSFLAQSVMNLPVLIVGIISSAADAGLFNGAMKLVFMALMIDRVFYAFFFPIVTRQRATDDGKYKHTASLALRVVLAFGIPITVAGIVLAADAMEMVYGSGFLAAAVPLQFLLLYFLFSIVNTVFMSVMIAENREREYVRLMVYTTAILVVLCVVLSVSMGAIGAAGAVAAGEGLLTAWLFASQRTRIFDTSSRLMLPAILSGLLMAVVMLLFQGRLPVLALGCGVLTFIGALVILKGFSKEEVQFLRERFV